MAMVAGLVGLIGSVALGFFADDDHSFRRFLHAYLAAYGFILSIGLGSLIFVLIQHLSKAGWSVNVRRIAESMAAVMPVIAALSLPIVVSVVMNNGHLYPWARTLDLSAHAEHAS